MAAGSDVSAMCPLTCAQCHVPSAMCPLTCSRPSCSWRQLAHLSVAPLRAPQLLRRAPPALQVWGLGRCADLLRHSLSNCAAASRAGTSALLVAWLAADLPAAAATGGGGGDNWVVLGCVMRLLQVWV